MSRCMVVLIPRAKDLQVTLFSPFSRVIFFWQVTLIEYYTSLWEICSIWGSELTAYSKKI